MALGFEELLKRGVGWVGGLVRGLAPIGGASPIWAGTVTTVVTVPAQIVAGAAARGFGDS